MAENEFQTTKFPDFWNSVAYSLTFYANSLLSKVSFRFPDFSRFSRSVATLGREDGMGQLLHPTCDICDQQLSLDIGPFKPCSL